MRTFFLILALAAAMPAFSQSMKMVVDSSGNVVGRYVRTNTDSYTVGVQDIFDVPKAGNKVVIYRAKRGQGVIWCKKLGHVNVYGKPSMKSAKIGRLVYEDGYVPETYRCLGKKRGWYKVKVGCKVGFIPSDSVEWDAIDTF